MERVALDILRELPGVDERGREWFGVISKSLEIDENYVVDTANVDCHDVQLLLSSPNRDFLVRNNGDQVKIDCLKGKKLGLYFCGSWCGPCISFTSMLEKVYSALSAKGDFEVIFVSGDKDEESFNGFFSKMPWLAIPYSDLDTRKRLHLLFMVKKVPHLLFLDENGKVTTNEGQWLIGEYGVKGYPFTAEKVKELKDLEEKARREQTFKSLLVTPSRDYVVTSEGKQVVVSELEGKIVGLYFTWSVLDACVRFTPILAEVYNQLKKEGKGFEIVMISLDKEEEGYKKCFGAPWLALPRQDDSRWHLIRYFDAQLFPQLVIIGADGKTLNPDATNVILNDGAKAYPFPPKDK